MKSTLIKMGWGAVIAMVGLVAIALMVDKGNKKESAPKVEAVPKIEAVSKTEHPITCEEMSQTLSAVLPVGTKWKTKGNMVEFSNHHAGAYNHMVIFKDGNNYQSDESSGKTGFSMRYTLPASGAENGGFAVYAKALNSKTGGMFTAKVVSKEWYLEERSGNTIPAPLMPHVIFKLFEVVTGGKDCEGVVR
ncbi:MAG: hypothetical protein AB7T14_03995 [Candidatus Methylacidiphilaceae bacterium]